MKRVITVLLLTSGLCLILICKVRAQEKDEDDKKDPYELMSNYYQEGFHPFKKSHAFVGLAFSLRDRNLENQARIFDRVLDGNDLNYDLTFKGGYFLNDYFMVGGNFVYSRDKFSGTVVRESDTVLTQNISSLATIVPSIRTYFPLTKNHRLSFFNEVGVGFGVGNTLSRDTKNVDEIQKAYSEEFVFTIGLSPGVTFFAIENFAFEVQLSNLIGYELQVKNTTTNETEKSKVTTNNVNFNIDLLSLNLGLAYYFGTKKNGK